MVGGRFQSSGVSTFNEFSGRSEYTYAMLLAVTPKAVESRAVYVTLHADAFTFAFFPLAIMSLS